MVACISMVSGGGRGRTPLDWAAASKLEAWYQWDLQQEFASVLYTADVGAAAISYTGTVPFACALNVACTGSGARSAMTLQWSDGVSAPVTLGPGLGATVALGNGITLALPNVTYTSGESWRMRRSTWKDNKNSHHFLTLDGTASKNPLPLVTPYGTFVSFDGISQGLRNTTTLAANCVAGTTKPFYFCGVFYISGLAPSSGTGSLLFFGDGTTNHCYQFNVTTTGPRLEMRSQNDAGTNRNFNSGATSPNTGIHVYECWSDGTTGTIRIDGATVATNTIAGGAYTLNQATLGVAFNSGAQGNPAATAWGLLLAYNDLPLSAERNSIYLSARGGFGF